MRVAAQPPQVAISAPSKGSPAAEKQEAAAPKDEVVSSNGPSFLSTWGKTIAGATAGAGIGFAAGGGGIPGAIVAGGATSLLAGVGGVVGAARLDQTEHTGAFGVGAAVVGLAAGAFVGAHADGGMVRLATAAVGGIAGGVLGFLSSVADWTNPNPKK